MKTPYIVTSKTCRIKEGYAHMCWMDIPAWKLELAVLSKDEFRLEYHHHEDDVYICSYIYTVPAEDLKAALESYRDKKIYHTSRAQPFFRFFFEYATGKIYARLSKKVKPIFELPKKSPVRLASYDLEKSLEKIADKPGNVLLNLVALTAIWAPMPAVRAQDPASFKYARRRAGDPLKGEEKDGIIYDDNTHPNHLIKAAVKKHYGIVIAPKEYSVCHIWEGSCYKVEYHTDLRNLVLLPRSLASLSDYDESVKALLKYHAYVLFDGWFPKNLDGVEVPQQPKEYKNISWLQLSALK